MNETIKSHKELIVWQKAFELTKIIYKLSDKLPSKENFGLQNQIRRAAVSVPSNIAEGRNRKTVKDFLQFLRFAYGSVAEVDTQLLLMKDLYGVDSKECDDLLVEVSKMLRAMIVKLEAKS